MGHPAKTGDPYRGWIEENVAEERLFKLGRSEAKWGCERQNVTWSDTKDVVLGKPEIVQENTRIEGYITWSNKLYETTEQI